MQPNKFESVKNDCAGATNKRTHVLYSDQMCLLQTKCTKENNHDISYGFSVAGRLLYLVSYTITVVFSAIISRNI